jgi:hypothetical protein
MIEGTRNEWVIIVIGRIIIPYPNAPPPDFIIWNVTGKKYNKLIKIRIVPVTLLQIFISYFS